MIPVFVSTGAAAAGATTSVTAVQDTATQAADVPLLVIGAFLFGALIGWYVYFINRWRKDDVKLGDLVTLLGAIGGAAVLKLFPAETVTFGAYGCGLGAGFFGYFVILMIQVKISKNFDVDWFLDGRCTLPGGQSGYPERSGRGMGGDDQGGLR